MKQEDDAARAQRSWRFGSPTERSQLQPLRIDEGALRKIHVVGNERRRRNVARDFRISAFDLYEPYLYRHASGRPRCLREVCGLFRRTPRDYMDSPFHEFLFFGVRLEKTSLEKLTHDDSERVPRSQRVSRPYSGAPRGSSTLGGSLAHSSPRGVSILL